MPWAVVGAEAGHNAAQYAVGQGALDAKYTDGSDGDGNCQTDE